MGELVNIEREPLVRSEEVAAYLNVSVVTVQKWARSTVNPIPCHRFGRRRFLRFRMSEVESWCEKEMAS